MPAVPELLLPAGNREKLETAVAYGADAVYLGGRDLNLRAAAQGFAPDELPEACDFAHARGVRVYFCLNAFPHEDRLDDVRDALRVLDRLHREGRGPDALIAADPGVILLASELAPGLPLHVSTQANTANGAAARFWRRFGAVRVNAARELNADELRAMIAACGSGGREPLSERTMGVEVFVHGARCMALAGRCLLSAHMNRRSANLGACTHPCRFDYRTATVLEERTRPGEIAWELPRGEKNDAGCGDGGIEPTVDGYAKILAATDLCLIRRLPELAGMGAVSLKIEGRTKTASYLAQVADAYRTALDDLAAGRFDPERYLPELRNAATRPLSEGFYPGGEETVLIPPPKENGRRPVAARILERRDGGWLVAVKARWTEDRDVTVLVPGLRRPVLKAGSYRLRKVETDESGSPLSTGEPSTGHPGLPALLEAAHPDLAPHLLLRLG